MAGIASGMIMVLVLAYSAIERAATAAMVVVGVAAFVALILGVVANRRLDRHLREAHSAAKRARSDVQEIIAAARDDIE